MVLSLLLFHSCVMLLNCKIYSIFMNILLVLSSINYCLLIINNLCFMVLLCNLIVLSLSFYLSKATNYNMWWVLSFILKNDLRSSKTLFNSYQIIFFIIYLIIYQYFPIVPILIIQKYYYFHFHFLLFFLILILIDCYYNFYRLNISKLILIIHL